MSSNQTTIWIVVAHRGGARLVREDDSDKLRVFETIDNPEGRLKDGERASDRGKALEGHGLGPHDAHESSRDHVANVFAGQLAERLHKARNERRFRELVLIAAPRFLGALRRALDPATAALVSGTLDKDFGRLKDHELLERLERM